MRGLVAVFNAGSSTLKAAFFVNQVLQYRAIAERIGGKSFLKVYAANGQLTHEKPITGQDHTGALQEILKWLEATDLPQLCAIGHRVVHGGARFRAPVRITPEILCQLRELIPLAPLHQPHNLAIIESITTIYPQLPQIACFDTAFHYTQPRLSRLLPLPRALWEEGVRRYGFHGLSYQSITQQLPNILHDKTDGKIIIAHLGSGASLCALHHRQSIATTMGFSTLDGLMMGTRCGAIDAGVIFYLMREKGMTASAVEHLLFQESGLKGVSEISADMRDLLASDAPEAREAIALYCQTAAKHIAGLTAVLGGIDALVFTAGIGQHQPVIRQRIADSLEWMGVTFDALANEANAITIHAKESRVKVFVLATDEEAIIAGNITLL